MKNIVKCAFVSLTVASLMSGCGMDRASESSAVKNDQNPAEVCPDSIGWTMTAADGSMPSDMEMGIYFNTAAKLGYKIGNGECAVMVEQAIASMNGKKWYTLTPNPSTNQDYVWGQHLGTVTPSSRTVGSEVRAGNVVQFENVTFSNGATASHHTVLITAVSKSRDKICVLHQNSNGKKYVQYGYYDFSAIRSGTAKFYRPIPQ
jgi:hypothetical protein